MTGTYAGDVSPRDAFKALESDADAVLVDVRTQPEWNYVGLPDLSALGKPVVRIEWQSWPDGSVNSHFAEDVEAAGVGKEQPVYLLCRSGGRSRAAAQLLTAAGWRAAYNVSDGFEGPHDGAHHRGSVAGWKNDGLPWKQG